MMVIYDLLIAPSFVQVKRLEDIVKRARGKDGVEIKNRSYLMRTYKTCFVGKEVRRHNPYTPSLAVC